MRRRIVARALLACAMGLAWSQPTAAAAVIKGNAAVCTGTVVATFSPAVGVVPATMGVAVSLSTPTALTCLGGTTLTISVSGQDPAGASCAGAIAALGAGSVSVGATAYPVIWAVTGLAPVQTWAFSDGTGESLLAVGLGISTDIGACPAGSISLAATIAVIT